MLAGLGVPVPSGVSGLGAAAGLSPRGSAARCALWQRPRHKRGAGPAPAHAVSSRQAGQQESAEDSSRAGSSGSLGKGLPEGWARCWAVPGTSLMEGHWEFGNCCQMHPSSLPPGFGVFLVPFFARVHQQPLEFGAFS